MKMPKMNNFTDRLFLMACLIPVYIALFDAGFYVVTGSTIVNKNWDWYAVAIVFLFMFIAVATSKMLEAKEKAK